MRLQLPSSAVVGPPKVLLPFLLDTEGLDAPARRRVALTSTAIAIGTDLFVIVAGRLLIQVCHISAGALMLASGVILFVHALDATPGFWCAFSAFCSPRWALI